MVVVAVGFFFCGIPVPGILVPKATKAIAVTVSLRPKVQPMCEDRSPITAVRNPISRMDIMKATYPSKMSISLSTLVTHIIIVDIEYI